MYQIGEIVQVSDRMQQGYEYKIVAPAGFEFDDSFEPHFAPSEMLELGAFEGKYCHDCRHELPTTWFERARVAERADLEPNYFSVKSRQPLSVWQANSWIQAEDPRGWFQWYCRYWLGRRLPKIDTEQINLWRAFRHLAAQIRANCEPGKISCRPRQRQALLQWSHDPFI